MTFTDYELDRMVNQAITVFVGQEFLGLDSSTDTPSNTDTTLDSEIKRFTINSVTLNTLNGTYTVLLTIPILELNGNTIRRLGLFDAITAGDMAVIQDLPSAYVVDTVHEVKIGFTITASAVDIT